MSGRSVVALGLVALGLVAAAALGTGCDDARNGAVRLTIGYAGFVPGCVRVRAEDAAAPSKAEERTLTPAEATFDTASWWSPSIATGAGARTSSWS